MDFVLWKPSKPGEPAWPSPCGIAAPGRPGWHIECSAMSWKHLGETFDIHGGGIDLVFPHHENEIAQSRCAFHTRVMANYWMHNGFLQVEGEKMSKSLGNFVTIHDLLADWPGEVVRLNMLRTNYRQPMDWTVRGLEESKVIHQNWIDILERNYTSFNIEGSPSAEVLEALADDLNTPQAVTEMHRLASAAKPGNLEAAQRLHQTLKWLNLVSYSSFSRKAQLEVRKSVLSREKRENIVARINERNAARKAKNFAEADRIRDELAAMGVELEDHKDRPTTWKPKK
jgi:cysteinyl-tRNA synthetase